MMKTRLAAFTIAALAASLAFAETAGTALCDVIAKDHKVLGQDMWYGHKRTKFSFKGRTAWVVEPSVAPLAGKPWTWTMQWADAFVPRTGVPDLLKRGFHHVTPALQGI